MNAPDYHDVQGLVRFGYGKLTEATYWLLRVRDRPAAARWLLKVPVNNAAKSDDAPETAVQVALTLGGLKALGTDPGITAGFSNEFLEGMAGSPNRSQRLGDVGVNDPSLWQWGYGPTMPDLLVLVFARPGKMGGWLQTLQDADWQEGFAVVKVLETSNLFGAEPFGFKDGVSQPDVAWEDAPATGRDALAYRNRSALGEYVLGYSNEYGKFTDRPLTPGKAGEQRDLGRNGSYLVFRQLEQDVQGFWRYLGGQTGAVPAAARELAAKLVGRKTDGTPLVGGGGASQNAFGYESDPIGAKCPVGAHVRRANPRNADLVARPAWWSRLWSTLGLRAGTYNDDVMASVRFHRLLRRGREYGPPLTPEQALAATSADQAERGIHFICLNANLSRQFEFVQGSWIMNGQFDGLPGETDPLLGNRGRAQACPFSQFFTVRRGAGEPGRIRGLPQFVTMRGGAYFFLPGIATLRYLAGGPDCDPCLDAEGRSARLAP